MPFQNVKYQCISGLKAAFIFAALSMLAACGGDGGGPVFDFSSSSSSSTVSSVDSSSSEVSSSSEISSSSVSSSSSSVASVDAVTIEGESLDEALSSSYQIEADAADDTHQWVGFFDADSYLCYSNVDLTGVLSLDLTMARDSSNPASFQIIIDDISTGTVLAEQTTTAAATGGWATFDTLNVGLDSEVSGEHLLCFLGIQGGGIFNLDNFTLSDQVGTNSGPIGGGGTGGGELPAPPTDAQSIAKITTSGSQVLFGGVAGSIAGPSLFWGNNGWGGEKYYNADVVAWVKNDWGANLIRAAMGVEDGGGYLTDAYSNKLKTVNVVNAAIENNMYVIIDWHSHNAEEYPTQAVDFFTEMATIYGEYDNVIYEIYNEPLGNKSWPDDVKPYAENVIAAIRAIDPDNLIIVGSPVWSQRIDTASDDPITGYENLAYTLHFYAGENGHDGLVDRAADVITAGNIAIFVTEWGTVSASGDGDVDTAQTTVWMDFLKANNISHANWALNDKVEGASMLVPGASIAGGWTDDDLTESGKLVKDIIKNW